MECVTTNIHGADNVIRPTIAFPGRKNGFSPNALGETGGSMPQGFEYNSGRNKHFLDIGQIREFNHLAGI